MANTCNILDPLDLMFVTFIALNLLFFCRVGRQQYSIHAHTRKHKHIHNPTHFKTFSNNVCRWIGKRMTCITIVSSDRASVNPILPTAKAEWTSITKTFRCVCARVWVNLSGNQVWYLRTYWTLIVIKCRYNALGGERESYNKHRGCRQSCCFCCCYCFRFDFCCSCAMLTDPSHVNFDYYRFIMQAYHLLFQH